MHEPTRSNDLLLQHPQQLGLQRQIDLGDFVQQDRAAVGRLEAAGPRSVGPGKGALFVAEQLAFHQVGREHGAIQADHRRTVAMAGGMDRPGDQLLAGAAFARDEHGLRRRADLQDPRPQGLHRRAGADHRRRAGIGRCDHVHGATAGSG